MKYGHIFYDSHEQRLNIRFEDGSEHGGLHCGETLEYLKGNQWTDAEWLPTRIEFDHSHDEWYLVGLYAPGMIPAYNTVRVPS